MSVLAIILTSFGMILYLYVYKFSKYEILRRPSILMNQATVNLLFLASQIVLAIGLILFFILNFWITLIVVSSFVFLVTVPNKLIKWDIKRKNPDYFRNLENEISEFKGTYSKHYAGQEMRKDNVTDISLKGLTENQNENKTKSEFIFSKRDLKFQYDTLIVQSNNLINENKFVEAEKKIKKAIEINPYFYAGYLNLGDLYKRKEEYEVALSYFNKAESMDNEIIEVFLGRATANIGLHNSEEANTDIEHVLTVDEFNADAIYLKGLTELLTQKYSVALSYFDRASKLNKKYEDEYIKFSQLFKNFGVESDQNQKMNIKAGNEETSFKHSSNYLNQPYIQIINFVMTELKNLTGIKDFEKIKLHNIIVKDENESIHAFNKKQQMFSLFGNLPSGHREYYYEAQNNGRLILITIAFFNRELVNFNIQIVFENDEVEARDLLFDDVKKYFKNKWNFKFRKDHFGNSTKYENYCISYNEIDDGIMKSICTMIVEGKYYK